LATQVILKEREGKAVRNTYTTWSLDDRYVVTASAGGIIKAPTASLPVM
jgi:hypothetical protein